jgi:hypothetical protein
VITIHRQEMSLVGRIGPTENGGENMESMPIQEKGSLSGKQRGGQVSTLETCEHTHKLKSERQVVKTLNKGE